MPNLRVVNLSNNQIERLEITGPLPNLVELNLRRNAITEVRDLKDLTSLLKLYLSGNQIASLDQVTALPALTDITLEGNPVDKPGFSLTLKEKFPTLIYYNLIRVIPIEHKSRMETLADKIIKNKETKVSVVTTPKPETIETNV